MFATKTQSYSLGLVYYYIKPTGKLLPYPKKAGKVPRYAQPAPVFGLLEIKGLSFVKDASSR